MKKINQILLLLLIGLLTLFAWYFFVNKYTYSYQITTSLDKGSLVELMLHTYPKIHEDLKLKVADTDCFIFQFKDQEIAFFQELKIQQISSKEIQIQVGTNPSSHFFKERWEALHMETPVKFYNHYLLLQLAKHIQTAETKALPIEKG